MNQKNNFRCFGIALLMLAAVGVAQDAPQIAEDSLHIGDNPLQVELKNGKGVYLVVHRYHKTAQFFKHLKRELKSYFLIQLFTETLNDLEYESSNIEDQTEDQTEDEEVDDRARRRNSNDWQPAAPRRRSPVRGPTLPPPGNIHCPSPRFTLKHLLVGEPSVAAATAFARTVEALRANSGSEVPGINSVFFIPQGMAYTYVHPNCVFDWAATKYNCPRGGRCYPARIGQERAVHNRNDGHYIRRN